MYWTGVSAVCSDDRSTLDGSVLLRWSQQGTAVVVSVLDWSEAGHWSEVNQRVVIVFGMWSRDVSCFLTPMQPVDCRQVGHAW